MEILYVKKSFKNEYIFYPNLIQQIKKGKVINEYYIEDIEEITYNEKFGFNDFIKIIIDRLHPYFNLPNSFIITLRTKSRPIGLKLKYKEYLKIKDKFQKKIKLI